MSIIKLLADFPNYSARKVRRLAKQISLVQRLSEMVALGQETGVLKGIEADLLEFNLLQAKTEEQLNDDVRMPLVVKDSSEESITDRICVTPFDQAKKVIDEFKRWVIENVDMDHLDPASLETLEARCRGLISGQSFYTDRTIIQARLSPQGSLPLDQQQ